VAGDILILGQRIVEICTRVAAITLKSREAILFSTFSNIKNSNFAKGDVDKLKCVGGP
jgi:hypothetical protein